jgi:hypothetical protein
MYKYFKRQLLPAIFISINAGTALALETIILEPGLDNTLYESLIDEGEQKHELSNGVGNYLFAGRTAVDAGFKLRRALLQFDLSVNLPADAEIVFASLSIYQSKSAPDSTNVEMKLQRVLQAWGEGSSMAFGAEGQGNWAEPGDATWHHSMFPTVLWSNSGGDFSETVSASALFGQQSMHYTWSCNDTLLADLNYWIANPGMNFGWIIMGGEDTNSSARRFNSRHNDKLDQRPKLMLVYKQKDDIFEDSFEQFFDCQ